MKALEDAMEDIGDIVGKNGESWSACAAFVEADERDGEDCSGVLIYVPGVALEDITEAKPTIEEEYYKKLSQDEEEEG